LTIFFFYFRYPLFMQEWLNYVEKIFWGLDNILLFSLLAFDIILKKGSAITEC